MALIDRIKYDGPERQAPWLVYKFPSEDLVTGSQIIVNKSQEAVFFKGGNALDVFGPGTHTLATANLPLLNKLVNLPFGGKTPFSAEVYFINKAAKLDLTWGTTDRFPVTEPRYGIIVNVGAFGQFGIKITDARNFTTQIVGALHGEDVCDHSKVTRYFKGLVITKVKTAIAEMIVRENVSLLEIAALLDKASEICRGKIAGEFDRFGLEVVNFFVESINIPEEDLARVKKTLEDRAEFNLLGDERYIRKRSLDVMETGAGNSGTAGSMIGAGLGLGLGLGAGSAAGELAGQLRFSQPTGGTVPGTVQCPKCSKPNQQGARFCHECGEKLPVENAICPACHSENIVGAKYCHQCGVSLAARKCPQCGHENPSGGKFCGNCGKGIES